MEQFEKLLEELQERLNNLEQSKNYEMNHKRVDYFKVNRIEGQILENKNMFVKIQQILSENIKK